MTDFPSFPHIKFPAMEVGLNRIRQCKHGVSIYPIADNVIGRALELYGEFAEDSNLLMSELVRSGDVAIDVGANVGTVTACFAKKVGQTGKVYAIENLSKLQLLITYYLLLITYYLNIPHLNS